MFPSRRCPPSDPLNALIIPPTCVEQLSAPQMVQHCIDFRPGYSELHLAASLLVCFSPTLQCTGGLLATISIPMVCSSAFGLLPSMTSRPCRDTVPSTRFQR